MWKIIGKITFIISPGLISPEMREFFNYLYTIDFFVGLLIFPLASN